MSAGLGEDSMSVVDSLGWRKLCLDNPTSASLLWALPKRAIRLGALLKFGMSKAETCYLIGVFSHQSSKAVSCDRTALPFLNLAVFNDSSAFN